MYGKMNGRHLVKVITFNDFQFFSWQMGYAVPSQVSAGVHMRQFARAFIIKQGESRVVFVSVDCGMIDQIIKFQVYLKTFVFCLRVTFTRESSSAWPTFSQLTDRPFFFFFFKHSAPIYISIVELMKRNSGLLTVYICVCWVDYIWEIWEGITIGLEASTSVSSRGPTDLPCRHTWKELGQIYSERGSFQKPSPSSSF